MTTSSTSDNDPSSNSLGKLALVLPLIAVAILLAIIGIIKSNQNPVGCSIGQTHDYVVQPGDTLYGTGGIIDREIEGSGQTDPRLIVEMLKDIPENAAVIGIGRDGQLQIGSTISLYDQCAL